MPKTTEEPRKQTRAKQPAKQKYVKKASNEHTEGSPMAEDKLGQSPQPPQPPEGNAHGNSMTLPPTTPRKILKTEIPSSQSPASTPLSPQSRRSLRMCSRSPLKERSTNSRTVSQLHSRGTKSIGRIPKLEVSDTYDDDNEELQLPGLLSCMDSSGIPRLVRSGVGQCRPLEVTTFIDSYKGKVRSSMPQENVTGEMIRATHGKALHVRNIMRDSNGEEEAENGLEEEDFDADLDTQAALQHVESLAWESSQNSRLDSDPVDIDRAATNPSTIRNAVPIGGDISPYQNIKDERSDQNHPFNPPDADLTDYRTRSSVLSTVVPPPRHTDSEQVSDQLAADLHRLTPNTFRPLVDTDSQIENAFRPYSPPPRLDDDVHNHTTTDDASHHDLYASSPQELPQTSRSPQQPIPPSQTTTVDITQPKHLTQLRSSSQGPPHSLPSNGPMTDFSVAPFVFSSSPLDGGELSSQYTPLWDGKPLTDSQLLPESLMNINIPPPPGWRLTEESLEEE